MTSFEANFITHDTTYEGDPVSFNIIDDEDGSTWWSYGHVERTAMIAEVNRWGYHCGGDPDWLISEDQPIEHLWANFDDEDEERFRIVSYPDPEAGVFPVTKLWL